MPSSSRRVAVQFDDREQQQEANLFGMWVFLASEVMFFSGFFAAYLIYRHAAPEAFAHASRKLDIWLGTFNTALLLTSSYTMALAVNAAHAGRRRLLVVLLLATSVMGAGFVGIKFTEYWHKYEQGLVPFLGWKFDYSGAGADQVRLFFNLYFGMTGLHAFHMLIGIGILAALLVPAARGRFHGEDFAPVEISGLYWHFVDIVWIFLFPLLYLIDRSV